MTELWRSAKRGAAEIVAWARRRPIQVAIWAVVLIVVELGVLSAGVLAERNRWPERARARIARLFDSRSTPRDTQTAPWREAILNQHTLEWASIQIGPGGSGGALVEVDGNIVFSTPRGRFNYLSANDHLAPINLTAPLNLAGLNATALADDPLFEIVGMRVHDLFARNTEPGRWELYATLSRFVRENCFEFVLARAQLEVAGANVRAASPDWEDLYVARPGCLRYKDHSWRFVGEQAGGRMQMLGDHTMLISVGDHQFDGFNDAENAPMDPNWDLGKLIAFDLNTRQSRVFASGLRNPQGLVIMRDGRIVETEHGPRGGDEINFIQNGRNYGWPLVTYGMNYGYPRRPWLTDPTPGGHAGYERPALAFVPSIGISNLVQPDAAEFPLWGDNDLLLCSLRAGTLFHVRTDGTRVAYVEPLPMDGERLRDIISMRDGRVVVLTDSGHMIIFRNAERHASEARELVVTGLSTVREDEPPPADLPPERRGRQMFQLGCASCHSLDGEVGIGPPLNGVVGRRIGSVPGFGYSQALAQHEGVWTAELLASFMTDPQHEFPGTTMPPTTLSWTQAPNIVAYLRTTRTGAAPQRSPQ